MAARHSRGRGLAVTEGSGRCWVPSASRVDRRANVADPQGCRGVEAHRAPGVRDAGRGGRDAAWWAPRTARAGGSGSIEGAITVDPRSRSMRAAPGGTAWRLQLWREAKAPLRPWPALIKAPTRRGCASSRAVGCKRLLSRPASHRADWPPRTPFGTFRTFPPETRSSAAAPRPWGQPGAPCRQALAARASASDHPLPRVCRGESL